MRQKSRYAGKTVKLRPHLAELGGHDCAVVDWYANSAGKSWRDAAGQGDARAAGYAVRRGLAGLPDDDDVLFARVDGIGQLVHVSEIDGVSESPPASSGPKPVDGRAVGKPCPACEVPLAGGDTVAVLVLGPGLDPAARAAARAGRPYAAVATELHWACATGDEAYTTSNKKRG